MVSGSGCEQITKVAKDLIKRKHILGKMSEHWSVSETRELLFIHAKDKINTELLLNTLYATFELPS